VSDSNAKAEITRRALEEHEVARAASRKAGNGSDGGRSGAGASAGEGVHVKNVNVRAIEEEATAARLRAQVDIAAAASRGGGLGVSSSAGGGMPLSPGSPLGAAGGFRAGGPMSAGFGAGADAHRGGGDALLSEGSHGGGEHGEHMGSRMGGGRSTAGAGGPMSGGSVGFGGHGHGHGHGHGGIGGAHHGGLGVRPPTMSQGLINAAVMAGAMGPGKVLEALNTAVLDVLQQHGEVGRLDASAGKPPAFAFAQLALADAHLPVEVVADVLRGVQNAAPALAVASLASPKGFHHVVSLLMPLIAGLPDDSVVLSAATDAFVAIGISMCDPTHGSGSGGAGSDSEAVAGQLFRDFALPQGLSLLRSRPRRRPHVLRVAYAFTGAATSRSSAGRLALMKTLQERLDGERGAFVHCLAVLATLEQGLDERLADLYIYYAIIGMGSTSPLLRAAGISILASIVDAAPSSVIGMLPKLQTMAEDSWWQVQASLVEVALGVLRTLARSAAHAHAGRGRGRGAADGKHDAADDSAAHSAAEADAVRRAFELLGAVLGSRPGPAVLRVFAAAAAPLLAHFPAQLATPFIETVVALPAEARERLLGVNARGRASELLSDAHGGFGAMQLRGPSELPIALPCIGYSLPFAALMPSVAAYVRDNQLQNLELGHFQLLVACVQSAGHSGVAHRHHLGRHGSRHGHHDGKAGDEDALSLLGPDPAELGELPAPFAALVQALQLHLFVGLCDSECFWAALELLRHLVLRLPDGLRVLQASELSGSLLMMHQPPSGEPSEDSKLAIAAFFADVAARGKIAASIVEDLLAAWGSRYPTLYEVSPLRRVRDELRRN
jgi:hypothetical protein